MFLLVTDPARASLSCPQSLPLFRLGDTRTGQIDCGGTAGMGGRKINLPLLMGSDRHRATCQPLLRAAHANGYIGRPWPDLGLDDHSARSQTQSTAIC